MPKKHDVAELEWRVVSHTRVIATLPGTRARNLRHLKDLAAAKNVVVVLSPKPGANGLKDPGLGWVVTYCAFREPFSLPIFCDTLDEAKTVVQGLYALAQN
jgi:hypothetical protein